MIKILLFIMNFQYFILESEFRSRRSILMNALLRKVVHTTIVRLMRRASTYEDPINALVEKVGLICRKIQHIPEEYARKLH